MKTFLVLRDSEKYVASHLVEVQASDWAISPTGDLIFRGRTDGVVLRAFARGAWLEVREK